MGRQFFLSVAYIFTIFFISFKQFLKWKRISKKLKRDFINYEKTYDD